MLDIYTYIPVYKSSPIKMSFAISHKGRQEALPGSQENKKFYLLDSLKKEDISRVWPLHSPFSMQKATTVGESI